MCMCVWHESQKRLKYLVERNEQKKRANKRGEKQKIVYEERMGEIYWQQKKGHSRFHNRCQRQQQQLMMPLLNCLLFLGATFFVSHPLPHSMCCSMIEFLSYPAKRFHNCCYCCSMVQIGWYWADCWMTWIVHVNLSIYLLIPD